MKLCIGNSFEMGFSFSRQTLSSRSFQSNSLHSSCRRCLEKRGNKDANFVPRFSSVRLNLWDWLKGFWKAKLSIVYFILPQIIKSHRLNMNGQRNYICYDELRPFCSLSTGGFEQFSLKKSSHNSADIATKKYKHQFKWKI